ncbi:hypothetical protein [Amycolatopsis sp. cmx-11-51]|uniref:hypothetical protein n=1 Tax=Amycolatopsis sp. cmx-11-51 TaxID=2785797 RepID=UPI0039E6D3A2
MTFWGATLIVGFMVGVAVGIVIGMAVHSRALRAREQRVDEKLRAAEHGIQLLVWHTGQSREQLWNQYRFRRSTRASEEDDLDQDEAS